MKIIVEELNPLVIFNIAVFIRDVVTAVAVFRNVDRNITVAALALHQRVVGALREDLTAPVIELSVGIAVTFKPTGNRSGFPRGARRAVVVSGVVDGESSDAGGVRFYQHPAVNVLA